MTCQSERATLTGMSSTTFGGYSSDALCDAAEITYRQLDYWVRLGLIEPIGPRCPGSGAQRRFTSREVRVCCAIARLRDLNCPEPALRHVAPFLRAMAVEEWHGELLVSRTGAVARLNLAALMSFGEACWLINLDLCARRAA